MLYYFNYVPIIINVPMEKTPDSLNINEEGIKLIKRWEGLFLKAYICPGGKITIGYGSTFDLNNKPIKLGQIITKSEAEEYLNHELDIVEKEIAKYNLSLNSNQHSAITSLIYNIGIPSFRRSTILKLLQKNDYINAAKEFVKWNKVGRKGKLVPLEGLTNRRIDEMNLFNKPLIN